MTLADGGNIPGIGGNGGEQTFCDGEAHEHARINRTAGVLEVSLISLATPRIRLDFRDCVVGDSDCFSRDFPAIVTGDPLSPDSERLAVIGFESKEEVGGGTGEALDFTGLKENVSTRVALVVRLGLFNENGQQIRINGTNLNECPTSDEVTVTRISNGCWKVESRPHPDDRGCLFKGTGRGKNASIELQGTYYMPFTLMAEDKRAEDASSGIDGCP